MAKVPTPVSLRPVRPALKSQVLGGASVLVRKGEQRVLSSKGIVFPVAVSMFPSQDEYHAALGRLLPGVRR